MYSLLIVDDEPFVYQGLEKLLPWEEYDISLCSPCYNVSDAIEYLQNHTVDMLLTDIQMPELSGIGLLRYIRKSEYPIHCMVLSGYDDFEYVKAAAMLGIENYFLKPINLEEFSSTLIHIIQNIEKEKQTAQKDIQKNHVLRENFIHAWLNNSIDPLQIVEKAEIAELDIRALSFCAAMVNLSPSCCSDKLQPINKFNRIYDMISALLEHSGRGYCVSQEGSKIALVMLGHNNIMQQNDIEAFFHNEIFSQCLEPIVCCIGSVETSPELLYKSYHYAKEMMRCAIFETDCSLSFFYDNILIRNSHYFSKNVIKDIRLSCVSQKWEDVQILSQEAITVRQTYDVHLLKNSFILFLLVVFSELDPINMQAIDAVHIGFTNRNFYIESPEEFLNAISYILAFLQNSNHNSDEDIGHVQQLKHYIATHFSEPLSLKQIGEVFQLSPSYLGQLFLNETGMTFSSHLNQVRIQQAQQLLKNTSIKLNEISQSTGFGTVNYFVSVFRKATGYTPTEYRKIKKEQQELI